MHNARPAINNSTCAVRARGGDDGRQKFLTTIVKGTKWSVRPFNQNGYFGGICRNGMAF